MTKLTRKLFVSIMTLVLTVMALGTSTFAWFSMNTTVTATNMTVTAKSNATYLFIGTGEKDTATEIQADQTVTVVAGQVDAKTSEDFLRYPCAFNNTASVLAIKDANGDKGSDGTTAWSEGDKYSGVAAYSWYTATNKNNDAATDEIVNVKTLDFADSTNGLATEQNYVVKYKLYLTLSADSEAYASTNYIRVGLTTPASDDLIGTLVEISESNGTNKTYYDLDKTNDHAYFTGYELTSSKVIVATIYMYIDGNSENVYSDFYNDDSNASHFTGTVGLQFDLKFETSAD